MIPFLFLIILSILKLIGFFALWLVCIVVICYFIDPHTKASPIRFWISVGWSIFIIYKLVLIIVHLLIG